MRALLKFGRLYILAIPLLLTLLGASSNQLVLFANNDKFPVMVNPVKAMEHSKDIVIFGNTVMLDDTHCLMTPNTHLNLLGDIFDFHDETDSIGDLLLDLGDYLWQWAPFVWGLVMLLDLRNKA